jgi:NADPH:quinone reductase-like Zn-dependent oxidoreductase
LALSDELVERARAWVAAVHPHGRHLDRTLVWLLVLDPGASEALRLAAVLHDIERAFEPDDVPPDGTDPASSAYTAWHQERSARVAGEWLAQQGAPPDLVDHVRRLVRVHEDGGDPEADLLQAADSISFLETQIDLFIGMVRDGRRSRAEAERKFRWMFERLRVPRAREIAAPMLAAGLARLDADTTEGREVMRAYVLEGFEAAPRMTEVAVPVPADDEILVRVHSVSVNPVDLAIASGGARDWLEYRFPVTLGRDLAGVVEAVGPAVTMFAPGDRVFGYIAEDHAHRGSFSEYVAIPQDQFVIHQPDGIGQGEAGALGLASVTATMCLDAAGVASGSRVLINGATGGVGSYATQIAKARGADVIATARPGAEEDHVRALGADEVIDWSAGDVGAQLRRLHPEGVDALIDVVTGDADAFAALAVEVLTPDGKAATTLNAANPDLLDGREGTNVWSSPDIERMQTVAELVGAGRVRAPLTEVYEFDRLEDAFDAVRRGAVGKVGVQVLADGEAEVS